MPGHGRSVRLAAQLGAAGLCGALAAVACGGSFESIYEADIRFEHCYRLDLDEHIAASHRMHCWSGWLEQYTFGQPRDRIEYATRRLRALRAGDTSRPSLQLASAEASRAEQPGASPTTAPAPTSPHAPPPAMAPPKPAAKPDVASNAGAPADELRDPSEERECLVKCYATLELCRDECIDDERRPCDTCEPAFLECGRRCVGVR